MPCKSKRFKTVFSGFYKNKKLRETNFNKLKRQYKKQGEKTKGKKHFGKKGYSFEFILKGRK